MSKKDSENGSAIVLAILLLSFFMALSLNMFFIAQKKSERAGVKAKGVKVLTNIDGGASIAYYELKRASDYVTDGIDLVPQKTEVITVGAVTATGINGVVLENYNQFMSERLNNTATQAAVYYQQDSTSKNWIRKSEMIRLWEITQSTGDSDMSIGGYKIALTGGNRMLKKNSTQTNQITSLAANDKIEATYEKFLRINGGTNIGDLRYNIRCVEKYELGSGGLDDVEVDDISDMTVTFIGN